MKRGSRESSSERLAQQADGAGEGAFGDGGIGPDGVEQLLLADEAAAILDEVEEQAERLGLEGDGARRPQ